MKVKTETIVRTIILFVTLANQILTMFGRNPLPFAEDDVYAVLTTCATLGVSIWTWWKNNSFTQEAIAADEYMEGLKSENEKEE